MSDLESCSESDSDEGSNKVSFAQMKAAASGATIIHKCDICGKKVFQRDEVRVGKEYVHRSCFKCCKCKQSLTIKTFKKDRGKYYCPSHYPKFKASSALTQTDRHALNAPSAEKGRGFKTFKKADPKDLAKEKEHNKFVAKNEAKWAKKKA